MENPTSPRGWDWISKYSPCFVVNGEDVQVLFTPTDFYQTLMDGIKSAKRRIVLSSLYLGTGTLESDLAKCLLETLRNRHLNEIKMDVDILFDFARGTRAGAANSKSVLLPIYKEFNHPTELSSVNFNVYFFHTPQLRGIYKQILPSRWNEIVGVSHIKVYLFDDTLVLSGANLSYDYFTQRQDRYIQFKNCSELSNYFHSLVKTVGRFSFELQYDGTLKFSNECPHHPVTGNYNHFIEYAAEKLKSVIFPKNQPCEISQDDFLGSCQQQSTTPFLTHVCEKTHGDPLMASNRDCTNKRHDKGLPNDTFVFPCVQLGFAGIKQDEIVTEELLKSFVRPSHVCFTSGYFNITDQYAELIAKGSASFDIFTASPEANGFLGAAGFSGYVPSMYICLVKKFYEILLDSKRESAVQLWEYTRPNWTYHAKGLWFYEDPNSLPTLTMIGSPNYGYRSVYRDLEAQAVIVTSNQKLRHALHLEKCNINDYSTRVTADTFSHQRYFVHRWVKAVSSFIKHFF